MALSLRTPTGIPPWPVTLIAGMPKSGKSYAAAEASASPLVGRTFWFTTGEDDPDEYAPLGPFQIVQYDGTYRDLRAQMIEAKSEPTINGKPNLWVLDSGTKLWDLISDMAQVEKNRRWANKQRRAGKPIELPDDGIRIDMDLWNVAKSRWYSILDLMLEHQGPSIITARLEKKSAVDDKTGEPTKEKIWKVSAEKNLAYDCGVVVELHARGEAYLTGVRSLRFKPTEARTPYPDFTMHDLWTKLGLDQGTGPRVHVESTGEKSVAADDLIVARRKELLDQMLEQARNARVTAEQIAAKWLSEYHHDIRVTTDIGALELMLDDLKSLAKRRTQSERDVA